MNAKQKDIERDIQILRRAGGVARELAKSKIDSVAASLSRTLDKYSYAVLERALGDIIAQHPSVKNEFEGSAEEREANEAERIKNPLRDDYARMSASEKLEAANAKKHAEIKIKAAENARLKSEHSVSDLKRMSVLHRLELANAWKRAFKAEDVSKAQTLEQIQKLSPERKLDIANERARAQAKAKSE